MFKEHFISFRNMQQKYIKCFEKTRSKYTHNVFNIEIIYTREKHTKILWPESLVIDEEQSNFQVNYSFSLPTVNCFSSKPGGRGEGLHSIVSCCNTFRKKVA